MVDVYNQAVKILKKGKGLHPAMTYAHDMKASIDPKGVTHQLRRSDMVVRTQLLQIFVEGKLQFHIYLSVKNVGFPIPWEVQHQT